MPKNVKVLVLRTAGTNCDQETCFAFEYLGAKVDLFHINRLFSKEVSIHDYHIIAIPGGFTYGDDITAGRILGNELRVKLGDDLKKFIADGKLMIGICNGFQVLVKAGILPGGLNGDSKQIEFIQNTTLMLNDSAKFEDRWIHLKPSGRSVWTEGMDDVIYLPVAHAEGKFVPQDETILNQLKQNQQIIFRYCDSDGGNPGYPANPNGAVDHIAGITDKTGHILGMMPHPERHFLFTQSPHWTRTSKRSSNGDGMRIFENGVQYASKI